MTAMLHVSRSSLAMHESSGRSLNADAHIYYSTVLVEMNKAGNLPPVITDAVSDTAMAAFKNELLQHAKAKRYEASCLEMAMQQYEQKERQRRNRLLLIDCAGKAQEKLAEQSKGTPWKPITERHVQWLEMIKTFKSYKRFDEAAYISHQWNKLRYIMLLQEAEEAERMAGEV